MPAAGRVAARVLARARGVEPEARVRALDREVAAERERRARRRERRQRRRPARARARGAPRPSACRSSRASAASEGITPSASKRGPVGARHDLGVLDPRAQRREPSVARERARVGVEHHAVAAVADGVRRGLEPGRDYGGERSRRPRRHLQQAGLLGRVAVGLEQSRAARADRAVDHQLRADARAACARILRTRCARTA
jgi:hypothetical protein